MMMVGVADDSEQYDSGLKMYGPDEEEEENPRQHYPVCLESRPNPLDEF